MTPETGNGERGKGKRRLRPLSPFPFPISLVVLLACTASPADGPTTRVTIPPRSSFSAVTDTLVAAGAIDSPRWFRLLARLRGIDRRVQAGIFDLPAHTDTWHLLSALAEGRIATVKFTAPEGPRGEHGAGPRSKVLRGELLGGDFA